MSVVNIFNVPTTPNELAQWSFLHMAMHRGQNLAVFRQFKVYLPEYVLDPFDPQASGGWFYNHQLMHNNMDAILGVSPFDLIDVQWSDEAQRIGWVQSHAQQHQQETNQLDVFS